jgi:hypothetical protein
MTPATLPLTSRYLVFQPRPVRRSDVFIQALLLVDHCTGELCDSSDRCPLQ